MVTRDTIGANQSSEAIWPGVGCVLRKFASAGSGVVRARSLARDVILKFAAVFAEIVEQSDHGAKATSAKFIRPQRREPRHLVQMLRQRLPCLAIPTFYGMGEEHERFSIIDAFIQRVFQTVTLRKTAPNSLSPAG
jgi:hypothetical protein